MPESHTSQPPRPACCSTALVSQRLPLEWEGGRGGGGGALTEGVRQWLVWEWRVRGEEEEEEEEGEGEGEGV